MTHYHSPIKLMAGLDGFKSLILLSTSRPALGIPIPHVKDELSRRLIISDYCHTTNDQI